jgi:drug/metabolite transporter (DMT)-like permease
MKWDPRTVIALVVGVVAVSSSGALIAYAAAPALAIAFWRNALATGVLAPVTITRKEIRGSQWGSIAAGVALAAHFGTWVPSVKLTNIATATALVCTQPIWAGLISAARGARIGRWVWVGMLLAVVGAVIATGGHVRSGGGREVLGDLLALAGALAGAVYTLLGERVRRRTTTTAYTTVCYGVCALSLLAVCLLGGVQMTGYAATAWLAIIALTVGPQLLGHSMFNYALHKVSATLLSVIILVEVPGAIFLGWVWLDQRVSLTAMAGIALLLVGVAVVILNPGERSGPHPLPASDL